MTKKGHIMSEEHKAAISKANSGRKLTQEHKDKISGSLMGRAKTKEQCQAMSRGMHKYWERFNAEAKLVVLED
jgi:hypothetical protein